tara:strand:- start:1196 stop:1309 length:114 start_codon:yes stop_codon:yes gene_type:complete
MAAIPKQKSRALSLNLNAKEIISLPATGFTAEKIHGS